MIASNLQHLSIGQGDLLRQPCRCVRTGDGDGAVHGDAAPCQNMQRRPKIAVKPHISGGANDRIVLTAPGTGRGVQLLHPKRPATPVLGIAIDGRCGLQHQISPGKEAAVGMAQHHNVHRAIAPHLQRPLGQRNEWRLHIIPDAYCIQPPKDQIAPRPDLSPQIQSMGLQGYVLSCRQHPLIANRPHRCRAMLQSRRHCHRQQGWGIGIHRTKRTAIRKGEPLSRSCHKRPRHIQSGILPKNNAVGVQEKEVSRPIHPQRPPNIRPIRSRHPAKDGLNSRRIAEIDPLGLIHIELVKAMEQSASPLRPPLNAVCQRPPDPAIGYNTRGFHPQGIVRNNLGDRPLHLPK